jgi:hypothetical protein
MTPTVAGRRTVRARGRPAPALAGTWMALLAGVLPGTAAAYWGVTPSFEVGITSESNPRYRNDGGRTVNGVFTDARLELSAETPTNLLRLTPRLRETNYLGNNRDLNDDDFYLDLIANHTGLRGESGITLSFRDVGISTGEFESAIPDDPDSNPIPGGSGRLDLDNDNQRTLLVQPYVSLKLSPRNAVQLSGGVTSTEYDRSLATSYVDYTYSSGTLSLIHSLNEKNAFLISVNAGNFDADRPGALFDNNSDTYGLSVAYQKALTLTWSADINVGTSRTTVSILSPFSLDPESALICFPTACKVTDQNFVGNLSVRKRSERTTVNFTAGRSLAPRSDGTEVVQDQLRIFIQRTLSRRLTGSLGLVYLDETSVADIFRHEREYFTVDGRLRWQMTPNWSVSGGYSYYDDQDQSSFGFEADKTNNRWFLGVSWRGTQFRW